MSRGRNWFFTWNITVDDLESSWETLNDLKGTPTLIWMVVQLEQAPTTGQLHWQGTLYFKNPRTLTGVKRLLSRTVHLEIARGSFDQQLKYCTKEETRAPGDLFKTLTHGDMPSQGKRTDLLEMITYIEEHPGVQELELWKMDAQLMIQYGRRLMHLVNLSRPKRRFQTEVIVLWGPTGTGKSYRAETWALEAGIDLYEMPTPPSSSSQPWVDGLGSQPAVLLEDFEGQLPFRLLLRMMDPYPLMMPVKGAFANFAPRYLVITSNINPFDWYKMTEPNGDDTEWRAPLHRRLNSDWCHIHHVTSQNQQIANPFE